ncbi:CDP-glycerol glycerophosphotransferase family protein [Staphylococcus pseudintermedius]|uniref:glycosyltransferase n=1 Tax=Staphylococcus pseudintermedius TaxID=283734 RepID=UPI0009BCB747|nr:glycosyltransferase [Staphylococcus pseudintermedius]EGQ3905874.1 glycosyltransferase [Staphylococcus pseudintermedius]EJO7194864.1 CDP-glycerol glycerophosphotransferase family protein [Staphylococcus pseudintermedius]ELD8146432.1 CDP-glycerol glycerophosphotransferase family protein [Staphylococcus pseudintermedius]MCE5591982.1 CDP-glycerol glycerophosphotransferase family protein [Staphylococcus pseudintermedius]MCE5649073.1 CDP-glycerol glycerophosphotransferase family protein [Staphylo
MMKKSIKTILSNQLSRKYKFIASPILKRAKSKYQKKVNQYAQLYHSTSIKPHQILYQVRDGKSITDSPYAIFLGLNAHETFSNYQHIWVVDHPDTLVFYQEKFKVFQNVSFVIKESNEYLKALTESKFLINNATFPAYFTKKPEQVYINTWHGTPLKHMGFDVKNNLKGSQNTMKNFLASDYMISPNAHTTNIFKHAFKLDGLYSGEILEIGYPRIDLTINTTANEAREYLAEHLNLKKNPIILYCPTWRGKNVNDPENSLLNIFEEIKLLNQKLPHQVLVKVHPFVYSKAKEMPELKPYLVPDFLDTNQLMPAVDLMITDYSSIFFDFLVTDKPIVFYVPDLDKYQNERGVYIDLCALPGPVADNIQDVITLVSNESYKDADVQEKYAKFKHNFVNYENGSVTERLIESVFLNQQDTSSKNASHHQKEKILLYPGGMKHNGITTSVINLLANINYDKYDVTVFTNNTNNVEQLNNLQSLNDNVRIVLRRGPMIATFKELYQNEFVRQRGIYKSFEKRLYPKALFEREFRKIFGDSQFDYAIDYSGYAMFWSNLVLASDAKKKYILLHSDIKSDMERTVKGKRPHYQNLKGVISLYPYFDKLVSVSEATKKLNQSNFGGLKLKNRHIASRNTINIEKINQLVDDDSDLFEKNGTPVLPTLTEHGMEAIEFSQDDFKIVSVGRLSPEKGFDLLIKAVAELAPKYPQLKLYILGDGPLKGTLKSLVEQLGIQNHVYFLGQRRNPFFIVKRADVFALTSHYEGQSMVILEALTVGTHVLASDIIANRYVLEDEKYGMLVEKNEVDIAKGLEQFINGTNKDYAKFDAVAYNEETIQEFYSLLER